MTTATRTLDIRYELPDQVNFEVEVDAELLVDRAMNAGEQRADIEGLRAADVDDEVSVERGDFRPARTPALGSGGLDQAAGPVTGRIAEARTGVGTATGCVALRRTSRSCVRTRTSAGSPRSNASVTSATIASRGNVV